MFLSDERAFDYIAVLLLLTLPWLGTAWGLWGWLLEITLIVCVFWIGRRKGPVSPAILLVTGYGIAALSFRLPGVAQMGFVPFAALLTVTGWERKWTQRTIFFWSLVLAGLLGALPTLGFVSQGLEPQALKSLVNSTLQLYRSSGILPLFQQQGISEAQLRSLFEEILPVYVLIIPSLAAISSFVEFGLVAYFTRRWFLQANIGITPFSLWRLPWYAVWGAIIALASYLLGDQFTWPVVRGVGLNLMVVYTTLALVIGTSVYLYFLQSPRVPRMFKWVLILVNLFYFLFSVISLILFGLFDLVLNFRRLPDA